MAGFGLTLFRELAKAPSRKDTFALNKGDLELNLLCGRDGSRIRAVIAPIAGGYVVRSLTKALDAETSAAKAARDPEADQKIAVSLLPWAGEKCPCCGAGISPIRCGQCRSLVCDAAESQSSGRRWFKCVPACGAQGEIREARIEASARPTKSLLALPSGTERGALSLPNRGGR